MSRMKTAIRTLSLTFVFGLGACSKPQPKEEPEVSAAKPSKTAFDIIQEVHESLEENCGQNLPAYNARDLENLELSDVEKEKAYRLLQNIGLMARQCADFDLPQRDKTACNPDCSWCPIKWYWCVENAGACAGGDNKSCCKLGACGSKHHCKEVCQPSCGCDVPPLL